MKTLVTGAAGFIGAAVVKALLDEGHEVVGLDNMNAYYATSLKLARLAESGIDAAGMKEGAVAESAKGLPYRFVKADLADRRAMPELFAAERFDNVVNLAGQAGVRHSMEDPFSYAESNILGFLNILESCRRHPVRHLVYASSSSIYGTGNRVPYAETDETDRPVSLYAATKKSDELMAYSYSKLYGIRATGLRFFTVYGPWGRPDMAPFIFMEAVMRGKPIRVFNHGDMKRDFTYIDDVAKGVALVTARPPEDAVPHRVYNIGRSKPVGLLDFIHTIERVTGREAVTKPVGMQPGDVYCTYADTSRLRHDFGYSPSVDIDEGIRRFYDWYEEAARRGII